jgi:uncharacterized protein YkwD
VLVYKKYSIGLVRSVVAALCIYSSAATTAATDEYAAQAGVLINNIRAKLDTCDASGMLGASASQSTQTAASTPLKQVTSQANNRRNEPATRPNLTWNTQLAQAALNHSKAMAKDLFFEHNDMQGRAVNHRVVDQGYRFRVVGENIAAGQASLEEAIRDWLLSAGHCVNMIDERFTEFGIAKVASTRPDDPYGVYWTLVLGQPRDGLVARR